MNRRGPVVVKIAPQRRDNDGQVPTNQVHQEQEYSNASGANL